MQKLIALQKETGRTSFFSDDYAGFSDACIGKLALYGYIDYHDDVSGTITLTKRH